MGLEDRRHELLEKVSPSYPGWAHFGLINGLGMLGIGACLLGLEAPTLLDWALIPGTFVFANWFEYWVHKGPLHRPTRWLKGLYERHTKEHHVVFTYDHMAFESPRELFYVLFPWWFFPFMLLMVTPVPLALWFLRGRDALLLFYLGAGAYYLVYEWFHTLHHLPTDRGLGATRLAAWIRRPHHVHHDVRLMTSGNFNVSFPLWDWLLGTLVTEREAGTPPR